MIERIERALLVLAYFIELDGDTHVPLYQKFEQELAELRANEETKSRARERLESYRRSRLEASSHEDHSKMSAVATPAPRFGITKSSGMTRPATGKEERSNA